MKPSPDIQAKLMARDPAHGFYARKPVDCGDHYQDCEATEQQAFSDWLNSMTLAEATAITKRFYKTEPKIDDFEDEDDYFPAYAKWRDTQTSAEDHAFRLKNKVKRHAVAVEKAKAEGRVLREYTHNQTQEGHLEKTAARQAKFRAKAKTPAEKEAQRKNESAARKARRDKAKAEAMSLPESSVSVEPYDNSYDEIWLRDFVDTMIIDLATQDAEHAAAAAKVASTIKDLDTKIAGIDALLGKRQSLGILRPELDMAYEEAIRTQSALVDERRLLSNAIAKDDELDDLDHALELAASQVA